MVEIISIHAPLRGRRWEPETDSLYFYFNPRPLAGATPSAPGILTEIFGISIHAPLRGRRLTRYPAIKIAPISIHAPLRGRLHDFRVLKFRPDFNPRPLAGATRGNV